MTATYDIVINQGETFTLPLTWTASGTPVDLTGATARMHIRENVDSSTTLIELTTENGRIALGGTAGTIDLTISAVDTAALPKRRGVYDLEIVIGAVVYRKLEGNVNITREVTR